MGVDYYGQQKTRYALIHAGLKDVSGMLEMGLWW